MKEAKMRTGSKKEIAICETTEMKEITEIAEEIVTDIEIMKDPERTIVKEGEMTTIQVII